MVKKQITIRDGEVDINYLQQGDGNTALLFLHGWCLNSTYWKKQIAYFANHYAVYAIDLAGFGASKANRENWTVEEYAKDVIAFIEALNLKNLILIGHSMSGDIMLETALSRNPNIIGLVGIDHFKFIDVVFTPEQLEQFQAFFKLLQSDFKTNAPIYAENMLFHSSTSSEIKDAITTDFANTDPEIGYNSFVNMMQFSQGVPSKLEALPHTLQLINNSTIPTNLSGLEKHCKQGFEIKDVGKTGHYPMLEKPLEFNQLLDEILKTISK